MLFPIIFGILVAISRPPVLIGLVLIVGFIVLRGVVDIVLPKRLMTGTPSPYLLYVENLAKLGELPQRPWLGYLLQTCLFYIPLGLAAFFAARFFVR